MSSPRWRATVARPRSERRQLIEGLEGALRALGLSDAAQVHIVSQLAPRIMAGEPASASKEAWTRMAV